MKFIAPAFLTLLLAACSGTDKDLDTSTIVPPDGNGDADTDTDTDTDTIPPSESTPGGTAL